MSKTRLKPVTNPQEEQLMSEHHRCPRSLEGRSNPENISIVPIKEHQAWHLLFKNRPPEVIAGIINKRWIDPEWEMVVRKRKKKQRR